jgi:hypothetical protein
VNQTPVLSPGRALDLHQYCLVPVDRYWHQQDSITRSVIMDLWKDLLFSDFGILSLITILVATGVVGYCAYLFIKQAKAEEKSIQHRDDQTPHTPGAR